MHITVFGATGSVGRRVVFQALARGHEITAVVRDPAKFDTLPAAATPTTGDARNPEDVARLATDTDTVISATRPPIGKEHELVTVAHSLLAALQNTKVRLLTVGGAGSLVVPKSGGVMVNDHPDYQPSKAYMPLALACTRQLGVFRADDNVDWVYISPAALLFDGESTGHYRLGRDELVVDTTGRSRISTGDLACAMLDEIEHSQNHRTRFTVAY